MQYTGLTLENCSDNSHLGKGGGPGGDELLKKGIWLGRTERGEQKEEVGFEALNLDFWNTEMAMLMMILLKKRSFAVSSDVSGTRNSPLSGQWETEKALVAFVGSWLFCLQVLKTWRARGQAFQHPSSV